MRLNQVDLDENLTIDIVEEPPCKNGVSNFGVILNTSERGTTAVKKNARPLPRLLTLDCLSSSHASTSSANLTKSSVQSKQADAGSDSSKSDFEFGIESKKSKFDVTTVLSSSEQKSPIATVIDDNTNASSIAKFQEMLHPSIHPDLISSPISNIAAKSSAAASDEFVDLNQPGFDCNASNLFEDNLRLVRNLPCNSAVKTKPATSRQRRATHTAVKSTSSNGGDRSGINSSFNVSSCSVFIFYFIFVFSKV